MHIVGLLGSRLVVKFLILDVEMQWYYIRE